MSPIKRLRCFFVGCNNEYSSHHLLPTSEPLKTQRINVTFALKWIRILIYINASVFVRIIRDPASSTEEVTIRVFYESLQIAFPNNVLVCQFHGWSSQYCSSPHGREGRGQQSSLAFKATWTKKQLVENRADFDRVKKLFFTLPLRNFNQSML